MTYLGNEEEGVNTMNSPLMGATASAQGTPVTPSVTQPATQPATPTSASPVPTYQDSKKNWAAMSPVTNQARNATPVAGAVPPMSTPQLQSNSFYRANRYANNPYSQQSMNPLQMQQEKELAAMKQQQEAEVARAAQQQTGTMSQINVPPTLIEHKKTQAMSNKFQTMIKEKPGTDKVFSAVQQIVEAGKHRGESKKTIEARIKNMVNSVTNLAGDKNTDTLMMFTDPSMKEDDRQVLDAAIAQRAHGKTLSKGEMEYLQKIGTSEVEKNKNKGDESAWEVIPGRGVVAKDGRALIADNKDSGDVDVVPGRGAVRRAVKPEGEHTVATWEDTPVTGTTRDGIPLVGGETESSGRKPKAAKPKAPETTGVLTEGSPPPPPAPVEEVAETTTVSSDGTVVEDEYTLPQELPDQSVYDGALTKISPEVSTKRREELEQEEEDSLPAGLSSTEMWGEALFKFGISLLSGKPVAAAFADGALGYFEADKKSTRMGERAELVEAGYSKQAIASYIQTGDQKHLKLTPLESARQEYELKSDLAKQDWEENKGMYEEQYAEKAAWEAAAAAKGRETFDPEAVKTRRLLYEDGLTQEGYHPTLVDAYIRSGDPAILFKKTGSSSGSGSGGTTGSGIKTKTDFTGTAGRDILLGMISSGADLSVANDPRQFGGTEAFAEGFVEGMDPGGIKSLFQSKQKEGAVGGNRRRSKAAQDQLIEFGIRMASGAMISEQEGERWRSYLFPQSEKELYSPLGRRKLMLQELLINQMAAIESGSRGAVLPSEFARAIIEEGAFPRVGDDGIINAIRLRDGTIKHAPRVANEKVMEAFDTYADARNKYNSQ